jgi:hypothetical protein
MDVVESLIAKLRQCSDVDRADILAKLTTLAGGKNGASARGTMSHAARSEVLEIQWDIEEIVEETTPAPPPSTEPEIEIEAEAEAESEKPPEPPQNPDEPVLVYDDPRGLRLYKTPDGSRWFALQLDPTTGQPRQMELQVDQVTDLKSQLLGSPYWVTS